MRVLMMGLLAGVLVPGAALAQSGAPVAQDGSPRDATPQDKPAQAGSPQAASAAQAAAAATDPIVVTARPLPTKQDIRSMIRSITPSSPSGEPLPRFHDTVCFGSIGLDRPTLIALGDRLASDAEGAGLKLGGARCTPNILVFFVDGIDAEVDSLVKRKWWVFGDRTPEEIRTITRERGPVRAWSTSETRSRDGDRINNEGFLRVSTASRVVSPIRKDMLASIVLIERSAVVGKTPNQVADYVAMRTLAGVRPRQIGGKETILALFEPGAATAPAELTAFDRGYLRGLYAGPANTFSWSTQGQIARQVLKEKEAETAPGGKR